VRSVLGAQVRVRSLDANLGSLTFHHIFLVRSSQTRTTIPAEYLDSASLGTAPVSREMNAFRLAFGKARLKNKSLTFGAFMATYNYQIIVSEARLCSIPVKSTP
jgi:hypothetical protein